MSSPIAIPRVQSASSSGTSSWVSSPAMSSAPTSVSSGLYVPVHKRTSLCGSSRPSSPASETHFHSEQVGVTQPQVYSTSLLLSLRHSADESMKEKMRASCPEVVMNRRMRKSHEFHEHQMAKAQRQHVHENAHQHRQHHHDTEANVDSRRVVVSTPHPTSHQVPQQRSTPRRSQPGRATERRRQALHSNPASTETWRGMRITSLPPLAVI